MSLINVITRFSREEGFKKCLESLNSQTYEKVHHYITYETQEKLEYLRSFEYKYPTTFIKVPNYNKIKDLYLYYEHHDKDTDYLNWDWGKWDVKVVLGKEVPPRKQIECKKERFEKDGFWCESLPHSLRKRSAHFPWNFYIKIAEQQVKDGWIAYLDDDDTYTSNESLEILAQNIEQHNEDTLHLFGMERESTDGSNILPSPHFSRYHKIGHPLIHGEVGSGTICFHSKYKKYTQWGEWTGDDYRTIKVLERVIPHINFIDQVLYNALRKKVESS